MPLCLDDRGKWRPGRAYHYADRSYADAVARAGGLVLALPIQPDPERVVAELDGLLLPGGDDLPPEPRDLAGQRPIGDEARLELVPAEQLAFDTALLGAALRARLPVLGICYGMQLMARFGGGRLDLHLPSQRPEAANHKLACLADRHPIEVMPGSRLARVLGTTRHAVNSLHHQAVREVGSSHRIVARSPDGVVEAIEAATDPDRFELGVQWHPEKSDALEDSRLFLDFVAACRAALETRITGSG